MKYKYTNKKIQYKMFLYRVFSTTIKKKKVSGENLGLVDSIIDFEENKSFISIVFLLEYVIILSRL